jgi:hypothetical protein
LNKTTANKVDSMAGLKWGDLTDLYLDQRPCSICGNPTYRLGLESGDEKRGEKEPIVCNKCLVDLRGDMATELEVRRQMGKLEARVDTVSGNVDRVSDRVWYSERWFNVAVTVGGFLAGVVATLLSTS